MMGAIDNATHVARPRRDFHRGLDGWATRRSLLILGAILLAVTFVSGILYMDARREATAALADFAREQVALAAAVAARLDGSDQRAIVKIEEPGSLIVLQSRDDGLYRPDGLRVESEPISQAIKRGEQTWRLSRGEAAAMGLPARMAVAGIARTHDGRAVAVVATALRVRDRETRAQSRLVLGIVLAALLVGGFGGVALRIQRKEDALERTLLVREIEKEGEERLARADKLATMGAFATGIAHEIATPLGVIATRADMLAQRVASDERASRSAASILDQAEKIRGIVNSFLALARGEARAQTRVEVRALLASALKMVEHRFAAARVELDVRDSPRALDVFGEPQLLEQALVNLLLNACDASTPGQRVQLVVRLDSERICFCVGDDGRGISQDVAARATEPFFTTKPDGVGTGLGLAIVNEIAKHHQGRFLIRPRAEGGTEARFEVLAANVESKEQTR